MVTSTEGDGFDGLEALQDKLIGRVSVFVGHSGVGKSTLVNGLVPEAHRAIGIVNVVTGRGRHTSSSAVALRLPGDQGWVIDTPGVRSFGLAHVDLDRIIDHFPDLEPGTDHVPPRLLPRRGGVRPRRLGRLRPGRSRRRLPAGVAAPAAAGTLRRVRRLRASRRPRVEGALPSGL